MITLHIASGECKGQRFEDELDEITIGRDAAATVEILDAHVSSQHAMVVFGASGYALRDHQSTNGTFLRRGEGVRDVREEKGAEIILVVGDVILLGDEHPVEIIVERIDEEDASSIVQMRGVGEIAAVEESLDGAILRDLYQSQRRISSAVELEDVLHVVSECVFERLSRATHFTVALREEDGEQRKNPRYVPICTHVRGGNVDGATVPITRSVFRRVVRDRAAVLARDAITEVGETQSMLAAEIRSTIGVPLWKGEEILGVIQVDNREGHGFFEDADLDVLALLAQSASQAVANSRLVAKLRLAEEKQRSENSYLKGRARKKFSGMIGDSSAMEAVFTQLKKVVNTRVTVLVTGETGTGKELVSRAVHYWSNRSEKLFVAQNCAALPENLLESELFGHKKGAFTGASEDKKGLFELAHEGTLFLDEIGEMPMTLQAKLLRVLQEGEVRRVGDSKTLKVDVRVVAATNRSLEEEVKAGRFREDLYYRLNVFPIRLPALRERPGDIPSLANHFLRKYNDEFGRQLEGFSQEAIELLCGYRWPGNVRELENELQRIVIQADDTDFVQPEHVGDRVRGGGSASKAPADAASADVIFTGTLKEIMAEYERGVLRRALAANGQNKSATAKKLGITREGLHKKLRTLGVT